MDREELFARQQGELFKRQLSNTENLDKAILTLSSSSLGISLAFIKNVVDINSAELMPLLIVAWSLFIAAISITLISFITSQFGISSQLKQVEEYYIDENEEAFDRWNWWIIFTDCITYLSALVFIAALTCLLIFVSWNFSTSEERMTDKSPNKSNKVDITEGATTPKIQAVPNKGDRANAGATTPPIQRTTPKPANNSGGDQSKPAGDGSKNE